MASKVITYFDPGFKIHTSYHNSSFILRTPIHINGLPVQIRDTGQGPSLSFTQSGVSVSAKLWEISRLVGPIFLKYGVYHVDTFYYEQFPLFQVAFPSEVSLKRFLNAVDAARSEVESALTGVFTEGAQSSESGKGLNTTPLKVQAKVELFLVSPSHEKNKATNIYPITLSNLSSCTSLWKNSELFEFGRVFATYFTASEEGHPEPQPVITGYLQDRKDTCQENLATFTIQATGSKPLQCCWEWRPPGMDWQPIPGGGDLIQGLETTALTITGVRTSNEGSYRCTVTICAGSEASDTAELTVAESPQISTQPQDQMETVTVAVFTVQATGTEPLTYCWEWKPQGHDEWKVLSNGVDEVQGADTATLTIAGLLKSHKGSYRCTVTNCAGRMASESANLTLADRPKIVSHPEDSRDVIAEEKITFSVRVTGTQPLSYQWDSKPLGNDWQPLPSGGDRIRGADTTTLTITSVQKSHEGSYRCTVTNCAGSETSDTAELTVAESPQISTQPQDQMETVTVAVFTVQATGTEPLTYCWEWKPQGHDEWKVLSNGVDEVQGADTATLTIAGLLKSHKGSYRCTVTNCAGRMASESANLTLADRPKIVNHPEDSRDVIAEEKITFSVRVTGTQPLSYQWDSKPLGNDWQPLPSGGDRIRGVDTTTLTITSVQKSHEGRYRCTVTNCAGSEASDTAELTVAESPQISTQPQDLVETVTVAVFTVQATGTEPLAYCWEWKPQGHDEWKVLSNGVDEVQGADTATLTIAGLQKSHEGSYRCTVTNCAGRMASESANLTLADRPKIVSHPEDSRDVVAEEKITFSIQATGTQPLSYQWDSKPLGNDWQPLPSGGDRIRGVDTTTLTITSVQKSHEGSYRCIVTNCAGSEASWPAGLTVVVVELRDLLNELQDVDDWFHFGIYLKVPVSRLREIKREYQTVTDRKINVLDEWRNQVVPTWAGVVQALVGMGRKALATHIGSKYGVSVSDYVDKQPSLEHIVTSKEEQVEDVPTSTEVEKLKEHVMKLDEQLLQNKEELNASAASQKVANENLSDIKDKLSEVQDKVQRLVHEKHGIQTELKYTERDIVLLQEMKDVYKTKSEEEKERSKEKEAMLQKIIDEKNKEIVRLSKELQAKEAQLQPLYKEVNGLRVELAGRTAELLIKTKQVNELEREKDRLISTCNSERGRTDMLLQQMTAQANSHESYRLEIKQQLSDLNSEKETRAQQLEALTAKNVELEKEIGGLSAALEERESEVTAFQKDDGEEVLKISAMEQEIAELKVKLCQAQSLKEQKQIQRDVMLQDGEKVEQFAIELQTLLEPPKITTQPRSCGDVFLNTTVTFTVQASGIQPLWYRWESEQGNQWVPLSSDGDRIQGVETATLTIDKVQKADEVKYRCIVSNPNGSVPSEPATLRLGRSQVDPQIMLNWPPAGPREPTNYSASTLENACYRVDGIPTSDHPNEDRHFALDGGLYLAFGVFDGHDGPRVAGFASNYLMELFNTSSWKKIAGNQDMDMICQAMGEFFKATEKDFFKSISRSVAENESLQAVIPSGMKSTQAYQLYPMEVARIQQLKEKISGGSTAVVAVVCNDHLYVANVGNSRAVLICEKSNGTLRAEQLSVDHSVENEEELKRLEAIGLNRDVLIKAGRVGSQENTRSIGDYCVKNGYKEVNTLRHAIKPPGSAEPYIMAKRAINKSFRYLVLMTDGVYRSIEAGFPDSRVIDANRVIISMIDHAVRSGNQRIRTVSDKVLGRIAQIHQDMYQRSAAVDVQSPVAISCRKRDDMTLVIYKFPTASKV